MLLSTIIIKVRRVELWQIFCELYPLYPPRCYTSYTLQFACQLLVKAIQIHKVYKTLGLLL